MKTQLDTPLVSRILDRRIDELGVRGVRGLAEYAGMSPATLHAVAKGRRARGGYVSYKPSLTTLPALARALDLKEEEVTYLFTVTQLAGRGPISNFISERVSKNKGLREDWANMNFEDWLFEFAIMRGLTPETLHAIFYGGQDGKGKLAQPPMSTLRTLALVTENPISKLMYAYLDDPNSNRMFFENEDADREASTALSYRLQDRTPPMRRIEVKIAGSTGVSTGLREEPPIWIEARRAKGRDLVAFRIQGDSMEGGKRPILDGDLVIVDRDNKGQDAVPVVARLRALGGMYVCKLLKDDQFGKGLFSLNTSHTNGTPSYIPIEEVEEIVGRVIEVHRLEPPE